MKNKIYHTRETVLKSNSKIIESGEIDIIHHIIYLTVNLSGIEQALKKQQLQQQ